MQHRSLWSESLAVAMIYVMLLAPMLGIASQTHAAPLIFEGQGTGNYPSYGNSPHGQTLESLWGITDAAIIELKPANGVEVHFATHIGTGSVEGMWEETDRVLIDSQTILFLTETDPPYPASATIEVFVVSGTLYGEENASTPINGVVRATTVDWMMESLEPETVPTMLVLAQHSTIAQANQLVENVRDAEPYDPQLPQITCYSSWVGNNGFQCCALRNVLDRRISGCWSIFKAAVIACIGTGFMTAAGCFVGCIKLIRGASAKGCAIFCGIVFAVATAGCIWAASLLRDACIANAEAEYIRDLAVNGCWPPPPDTP